MRMNHEIGGIYDTLSFLSSYTVEHEKRLSSGVMKEPSVYYQALREAVQSKTTVPPFLYPFFTQRKDTKSFMESVFFDRGYSQCTFDRLQLILKNHSYIKRCFIAYCFPDADEQALSKLNRMDHPEVIDILIQRSMDSVNGAYFFYTLMNFDTVVQTLADVVAEVYKQIDALRHSIIQNSYGQAWKQESVSTKLMAITKTTEMDASDLTISISLMEPSLLSFRTDERTLILLGYDYEEQLNTVYRYSDISLYSFAQAISSNPAKYEIYQALLEHSPMTSADLSIRLKLSRSTLNYNLTDLVKSRIVIATPINKRTYSYSVNAEYMQLISSQISESLKKG